MRFTNFTTCCEWWYAGAMKRATVTVTEDMEEALDLYVRDQEATPSLTAVMQAALRDFLANRGYLPPQRPFQITPAARPSGEKDISINHDKYIAEAVRSRSRRSPKRAS